jgi:hypothetical protein
MLRLLRKRKTVQLLIFGGISVLFVLWGVGGVLGTQTRPAAGVIFGHKVKFREFDQQQQRTLRLLRMTQPDVRISADMLNAETWRRLMLLHEANARDLHVPNADVIRTIERIPFFRSTTGFMYDRYERFLSAQRIPARQFEEEVREQLQIESLRTLIMGAADVTESAARERFDLQFGSVQLQYIRIDPTRYRQAAQAAFNDITPAQRRTFYNTHTYLFLAPPQAQMRFMHVASPTAAANDPYPDATELQQLIDVGWTLDELADTFDQPLQQWIATDTATDMPLMGLPAITAFRSAAIPGELSAPILIDDGLLLLEMGEPITGSVQSFAETESQFADVWITYRAQQLAQDAGNTLYASITQTDEATAQQAAQEQGFTLTTTDTLTPADRLTGFSREVLVKTALTRVQDVAVATWSHPITLGDQQVLIRILTRVPADEILWKAQREVYLETLRRQQQETTWMTFMVDLFERANLSSAQ